MADLDFGKFDPEIDGAARLYLIRTLWGEGACPCCGESLSRRVLGTWYGGERVICVVCGWRGNWKTDTPLEGIQAGAFQMMLYIFAMQLGADFHKVANAIGERPERVKAWMRRLERFGGVNGTADR